MNKEDELKLRRALFMAEDQLGIAVGILMAEMKNFYIKEWDEEYAQDKAMKVYNDLREFSKSLIHYFDCINEGVDPWLN